jgi:hypothetical protein
LKPTQAAACLSLLLFQIASLPCYGQATTTAPAQSGSEKQIQVNWIYGAYVPKDVPLTPLTRNQRWKLYARQTYTTPGIYVKTLLFAGGDQISDSPAEWDGDWGGFARRVASRQGQFVIQNSLAALANGLLRYEPRYDRCRCERFWPRMAHATVRNFVTYDESETKKRPQIGLYGAALAAGAISSTWKPNQQAWTEGYRSAMTQAGFGIATNVISEFAPEIFGIFRKPKTNPPPTTNPPTK